MDTALLDHPHAPIVLITFANFAFVVVDAAAQKLELGGVSSGQIVTMRMLFTVLACLSWLIPTKPDLLRTLFDRENNLLWFRGAFKSVGVLLFYKSLEYASIADVTTFMNMKPFLVIALCWAILREEFSWAQVAGCVISLGGVVLVAEPDAVFGTQVTGDPHSTDMIGWFWLATALMQLSMDVLLVRMLGPSIDPTFMLLLYALPTCIIGPLWMLIEHASPVWPLSWSQWALLLTCTVGGLVAQITMVLATQREQGAKIAILGYFQIVFGLILQLIFTSTFPSFSALAGMSIIIVAGIWTIVKGSPGSKTRVAPHNEAEDLGYELLRQDQA